MIKNLYVHCELYMEKIKIKIKIKIKKKKKKKKIKNIISMKLNI